MGYVAGLPCPREQLPRCDEASQARSWPFVTGRIRPARGRGRSQGCRSLGMGEDMAFARLSVASLREYGTIRKDDLFQNNDMLPGAGHDARPTDGRSTRARPRRGSMANTPATPRNGVVRRVDSLQIAAQCTRGTGRNVAPANRLGRNRTEYRPVQIAGAESYGISTCANLSVAQVDFSSGFSPGPVPAITRSQRRPRFRLAPTHFEWRRRVWAPRMPCVCDREAAWGAHSAF